jgi:saposin
LFNVILAAIKTPNAGTVSPAMKETPQLCQLCEEFASEALFYLKENETQTEIIATMHQACSKFPSFKLEVLLFTLIFFLITSIDWLYS